jgi:hypothetical protein
MVLAVAPFGQLKIGAEGLALEVDEVAELTVGAESWLTVAGCHLTALGHVLMRPAEAYDA